VEKPGFPQFCQSWHSHRARRKARRCSPEKLKPIGIAFFSQSCKIQVRCFEGKKTNPSKIRRNAHGHYLFSNVTKRDGG